MVITMNSKNIITLAVTAAIIFGFSAVTTDACPMHDKKHKNKVFLIDTDKNDAISLDEAKASDKKRLVENFDEIDADSDGLLTKDELKGFGKKMRKNKKGNHIMKHLDKNADGVISREEAESADRKMLPTNFNLIDVNNDDNLSKEELKEFRKNNKREKK